MQALGIKRTFSGEGRLQTTGKVSPTLTAEDRKLIQSTPTFLGVRLPQVLFIHNYVKGTLLTARSNVRAAQVNAQKQVERNTLRRTLRFK